MFRSIVFVILISLLACGSAQSSGWINVEFDFANPASWTWIYYGTSEAIPSRVFSTAGQMLLYYDPNNVYSSPGLAGPIYTTTAYGPGKTAFYVEWIGNAQSATVFELLSDELMAVGQFSSTNCWPNCGELDIYEMLLQSSGTSKNYGAASNYGAFTLHKGSRAQACFCPSAGGTELWYENTKPMTSSCAAEFQNRVGVKNSIVTIFDQDANGQYIQLIQDPVITVNGDGTTTLDVDANSVATFKIYNNATTFYGNSPPSTCASGSPNAQTGWPWFNQAMHFIAWEQDYTKQSGTAGDTQGEFVITNMQIWVGQGVSVSGAPSAATVPKPGQVTNKSGPLDTNFPGSVRNGGVSLLAMNVSFIWLLSVWMIMPHF